MSPYEPSTTTVRTAPVGRVRRFAWLGAVGLVAAVVFGRVIGAGPMFVIVLLVVGVAALFFRDAVAAWLKWYTPSLEVAASPYPLGAAARVVYRRRARRPIDVSSCEVRCRLFCEEKVTYSRGTDTVTDKKEVFEDRIVGAGEGTAEGLLAELDIHLPASAGGPTLELANNEIHWFVEISVHGARLPKDDHLFELRLDPILDVGLRTRVQDS